MDIITNIPFGADGTEPARTSRNSRPSPLEIIEKHYGYQMTIDEFDCLQWVSDCVDADDAGLNVKWQRVLTIRKANVGRDCWTATFYIDREPKFHLQIFNGLSRAKAVAFGAVIAWHRNAKSGTICDKEVM